MYDVSIIIVNYNVKDLVDNCITSVYKASEGYNIEIFFVDNHSVDGSVKLISEKYPAVKIIPNKKNIGFAKANNIALKQATGKYILILNPDTVLEEGTFDKLIKFVEEEKNVGAVSSKLILKDGSLDSACRRSFPTLSAAIPRMLGLSKIFPKSKLFAKYNLTYLDENEITEVDAICGAFMFIPKVVLDKVGLFDEEYFMYGEDIDLCFKIKKAGYKIFYYPKIITVHLKGESTKKTKLSYVNNFYGAMSIFVRKNFKDSSRILIWILQFGIFYRSSFSYLKRLFISFFPVLIDLSLIFLSLVFSVYFRFHIFPNKSYLSIISVYVFIWLIMLLFFGVYLKKNNNSLLKTLNAVLFGFFINSSVTYFFKEYAYSREVVITSTAWALGLLIFWRVIVKIHKFVVDKNILLNKVNLLVVSNKKINENLDEKVASKYKVLYYENNNSELDFDDLSETIIINNIKEVVFSGEDYTNKEVLRLMWAFKGKNVSFKIVPSSSEIFLSKIRGDIDNLSLIEIEYNINNKLNIFSKRVFDFVLSTFLLITVYPFLKFSGNLKTSLRLLPKVWTGEFSFVGVPYWHKEYDSGYLGKRGITGLVQLQRNQNLTEDELTKFLIYYAKNQSFTLDLEILLKSFITILKK